MTSPERWKEYPLTSKPPRRGGTPRSLNDDERKLLAELGLPDLTPAGGRCGEAAVDAIGQARLSRVTKAVWFHDKTLDVPAVVTAASGVKAVQVGFTRPVLSKSLNDLADADDDIVPIAYMGGWVVPTDENR